MKGSPQLLLLTLKMWVSSSVTVIRITSPQMNLSINKFLHSHVRHPKPVLSAAHWGWGGGGVFLHEQRASAREKLCGKTQKCVYLWRRRAFWGRQGSGKTPLEDQKHSQNHPEGSKIQRSGRKRPEPRAKRQKILPISLRPSASQRVAVYI